MGTKKIIIAAAAYTIIANIVHILGAMAAMGYYQNPANAGLWSQLMMPSAGPPPMIFFYLSLAFGFIIGMLNAYVYGLLKKSIPGNGAMKGLSFGAIIVLVYTIPYTLTTLLLLGVPGGLVIAWGLEGLFVNLLGGICIAKIIG